MRRRADEISILFGEVITCAIDLVGDSDLFTFEASSGDAVIVQVAQTVGGGSTEPCVQVYFGGTLVDGACDTNDPRLDLSLSETGVYTIVVFDQDNNAALDYSLDLERILPLSCSTTPICFGCLLQDDISPVGDLDVFAFSGNSGDLVIITVDETSGGASTEPCVELFHPDLTVNSDCDSNVAMIDLTLNDTGFYNVVVSDGNNDASLSYDITVECTGSCEEFVLQCPEPGIFADGFETVVTE